MEYQGECVICTTPWSEIYPSDHAVSGIEESCKKHIMCKTCFLKIFSEAADKNQSPKCPVCRTPMLGWTDATDVMIESQPVLVKGKGRNRKRKLEKFDSRVGTLVDAYTCEMCGKGFKLTGSLSNHRKRHVESPKHKCVTCFKKFYTPYELRRHTDRAHPSLPK